MHLRLLADVFGIAKLAPPQAFPAWLSDITAPFFLAQTEDEYSIMCPQIYIPDDVPYSAGYCCLRVDDVAFDEIGVVARVSKPLADAGLSLFLVSTHDRDYVLVHQNDLESAIGVYKEHGFTVVR